MPPSPDSYVEAPTPNVIFGDGAFREVIRLNEALWSPNLIDELEVVKQEMARVNVDILGISELKWTGMGEFNSGDHYIYCCGQESLRRNGLAIIINKKSPKCSTWV